MSALESIVLPLAESRAMVEHGVKLDTALVWVYVKDANGRIVLTVMSRMDAAAACLGADCDGQKVICGAPVLSELLDAIRAKVKLMSGEIEVILGRDESEAEASCAALRINGGYARNLLLGSTDILAAYALLREVSK